MSVFLIGDGVQKPTDLVVAHAIEAASQRYDLPTGLLRSIVFNDRRQNDRRAPSTRRGASDPVKVADAAARRLSAWYKKYKGSWVHVLAAWRIGPVRVDNMLRGKTWQLTQVTHDYVSDVLAGAGMPQPVRIHNGPGWA